MLEPDAHCSPLESSNVTWPPVTTCRSNEFALPAPWITEPFSNDKAARDSE